MIYHAYWLYITRGRYISQLLFYLVVVLRVSEGKHQCRVPTKCD